MTPADRFRALLAEPGFHLMPGIWDGLSARLAAEAGFRTAFLSGFCVSATKLAGPDLDLISFGEMADALATACAAAPELAMLGDGDHGYGNALNVQRTVRAYARAGAACVLIEDKATPRPLASAGKPVIARDEARLKIRAAVAAAREAGILVLARTDSRPSLGLDEACARIEAFAAEGADVLFLDSPRDEGELARAVAAGGGKPMLFDLASDSMKRPSRARLAEFGFRLGVDGLGVLAASLGALRAGLTAFGADAPPPVLTPTRAELFRAVGFPAYDEAAKRLGVAT